MFNFTDPETLWLNVANALLGLVTLFCFSALAWVTVKEVVARAAGHARIPVEHDTHAFNIADLGITMADGGERIDEMKRPLPMNDNDPPNIIRSDN